MSKSQKEKTSKAGKWAYAIIALAFVLFLFLAPDNNVITWLAAKREIRNQEREMRRYQLEITEMTKRIETLRTNRDSLETFARERFHFCEEGEDVYLTDK